MNKTTIYGLSLLIYSCCFLIGLYLVWLGCSIGDFLLVLGYVFALIIIVIALKDVFSNETLKASERMMWLTGFIVITPIAGILYYSTYKERIDN